MRPFLAIPLLCTALALGGCQSDAERAEAFFRSGEALRAEGDLERAVLEYLNVFDHEGTHKAARTALAEVHYEMGDLRDAYSQYLRLAEQYPDDVDTRLALSELAVIAQAWDEVRRHGAVAVERAPERPETRAVAALLDYMAATEAEDAAAQADALIRAEALLAADPESTVARRLLIIGRLNAEALEPALGLLDEALARRPDDLELNRIKLQVLAGLQRSEAVEALLLDMYARFPEEEQVANDLLTWYAQRGDLGAVERILRERAGPRDAAETDGHVAVARFIARTRGTEAARAELAALIEASAGRPAAADLYTRIDAALAFEAGARDEAIAALRARLEDDAETGQSDDIRTTLARMLTVTGNPVGARALVEEVLGGDATNVEALKLKAGWLIEADRPDAAITALRTALDQAPDDAEILTLMAQAHVRAGSPQLAGERLALAVELSGNAVPETLRYNRFLQEQGRVAAARALLREALADNPGDIAILTEHGRLAIDQGDDVTAREAIARLEALEGDALAADRATALRAALLLREERIEEGVALLEARAAEDETGVRVLDVLQTRLRAGQTEAARAYLDARLAESADDPTLRFAASVLDMAEGDAASAEARLGALIAEFPDSEAPVTQLYRILRAEDRAEEADALLAAALERMPDARALLLMRAARLEETDALGEALAVYARLYELNSNDLVAANNYASLLSDLNEDEESLARAEAVARRLAQSEVPAFQDTYGWILHRLGDAERALPYLEAAAAGLPDNPVVQYHLGAAYAALGRGEDARAALERALEVGGGRPLPQLDRARAALDAL